MLWRCGLHLQTTVSGSITLPLVTSRFYTEDKNKPCAASHTEGQAMHFAYLRIKAERFSQLTVKVEKAAVEKPRVVTVKGLHLVQSISTQNRSLFPFTSLSPPTSQPKDFVDPLLNINPLATRQKVISTPFSKLQKPAAPLLFWHQIHIFSLPTRKQLACSR